MPEQAVRLDVAGLTVERGPLTLVADLSFSAAAGSLTQLDGPNGSGKTTVLRALAGLVTPAAGSVSWCGRRPDGDARFAADLNFVGHLPGLSGELDARENLAFLAALGVGSQSADIEHALARLGAGAFAGRPVRQLSAGQRQRIALARLVLFQRPLWMLDEPFTALDRPSREVLERLIDEHVDAGGVVVIATHQPFASRHPRQTIALTGAAP